MTRLALAPLVEDASPADLLALRICDPAAGAGAFLVEVVDYLAEHLVAAWRRESSSSGASFASPTWMHEARVQIARTCIVGVDIDEQALVTAARALDLDGYAVGTTLVSGDALALDWQSAFPSIIARGGFDIVLANPPYIRQESLSSKSNLEPFEVFDRVADLYVYFIELAHRLLRPRGRYCVIVPNKWMTVDYGRPLRSFLAREGTIDGVVDLSAHGLFANADAFPCIVWGTTAMPRDRRMTAVRPEPGEPVDAVLQRALLSSTRRTGASTLEAGASTEAGASAETVASPTATHSVATTPDDAWFAPRDRWRSDPWHIDPPSELHLLDRLARAYPTLGEVIGSRWSRGVVTGFNEAFVIDRATRDALLAADLACSSWIRPFVKGRDIRAYRTAAVDRWLLLVDRGTTFELLPAPIRVHLTRFRERLEPKPAGHSGRWPGRKPGSYAWFELQDPVVPLAKSREPRLFYQDIQTEPACSFDPAGELVPDTTVWTIPSSDRYLLAILNSQLYGWFARRRFPPALNGAVRPKLAFMQRLPIPVPSRDLRGEIESLVARRVALSHSGREDGPSAREPSIEIIDHQLERLVQHAYELSSLERAIVAR